MNYNKKSYILKLASVKFLTEELIGGLLNFFYCFIQPIYLGMSLGVSLALQFS